jgi:hypothetical protein
MRDDRGRGAGGWLGAAALVVAVGLAALAAQPWGGRELAPRSPGTLDGLVAGREAPRPGRPGGAAPTARPAPLQQDGVSGGAGTRGQWRGGETDGRGGVPEIRLPSELEPVRPDIVVALTPPEPGPVVVPHTHVTESADARTPSSPGMLGMVDGATATPDGATPDNMVGPEPGDLYWFGPEGLVRVQVLMEAQP